MTRADSVHSMPRITAPVLPPAIELHMDQHPYWAPFDAAAPAAAREGHPLAALLRLRQEAAAEIERLLAFLDETEGDPDAEAPDEPTDAEIQHAPSLYRDDHEDNEDGGDHEPCLGWTEAGPGADLRLGD